jgi:sigma-B regulation protein RsbU (phosphoserine phosphatase)
MSVPNHENTWLHLFRSARRRIGFLTIGANLIGALIVTSYFTFFDKALTAEQIRDTFIVLGVLFIGLVIFASVVMTSRQRNLWRYIQRKSDNQEMDSALQRRAQRVILDLPFMSAMMSLFNWLMAAVTMSLYTAWRLTSERPFGAILIDASRIFIGIMIGGIVVCAIIYFSVEIACRRHLPLFFPEGGMVKSPCTFRLKLPVRVLIIFTLASLLPIILMAVLSYNKAKLIAELSFGKSGLIPAMNPDEIIQSLLYSTAFLLATALGVAIILSRLFSSAIVRPVRRLENAMAALGKGDLTAAVPVENNDELGTLSENFNLMTVGLKERYELRRSLDLAREVQQSLLPHTSPKIDGLDIAGRSIYCDETGGDYYDYIFSGRKENRKVGIAIGDVAGHGISSALLMATVRSSLRQRSSLPGSVASILSDVNHQLVADVEDSGQFVTMFYMTIDPVSMQTHWVRAGHGPAIFYDPGSDTFEELGGSGIALGVDDNWNYTEYTKTNLSKEQIIFLSTDGIWEALNQKGEMFGKERLYDIIRKHSSSSAEELINTMLATLEGFKHGAEIEDDITLVVIKIT